MNTINSNELTGVKGWLLLLCLSLTIFDPISMLIHIMVVSNLARPYFQHYRNLFYLVLINGVIHIALITYSVYAGICLWRLYRGAVKIAKKYFIFLFFYSLFAPFLPAIFGVDENVYKKLGDNSMLNMILNTIYAFLWYLYLNISKRVKNTYNNEVDK